MLEVIPITKIVLIEIGQQDYSYKKIKETLTTLGIKQPIVSSTRGDYFLIYYSNYRKELRFSLVNKSSHLNTPIISIEDFVSRYDSILFDYLL